MKKISLIPFLAIALVLVVAGCGKVLIDYGDVQKITDSQTLLKINYVSQYANNRSIFIKINDARVSGLITGRTPFPGGGYNTGGGNTSDFLQIPAGDVKISIVQPKKINDGTDSIVLYSTTIQLAAGKNYVAHITDTLATSKTVVTEVNFARPDTLTSRLNFVNLMPNVPAIDLYYGTATASNQDSDSLLIANVAYLQPSPDFFLRTVGTNKTFKIRAAGAAKTSATVLASYNTSSVPNQRRSFTAFASGYSGKVAPSTQRPYISFFLIR
jgi:hypothetical protein